MSATEREQRVLDLITPRLKAEGYEVFTHPSRGLLPAFMQDYQPDAIALGRPKNIAIQIARDAATERPKAAALTERFATSPDWELRIVYAPEGSDDRPVPGVSRDAIPTAIARVESLLAADQPEAALLLGWSVLEAVGRLLLPGDVSRPQPAGQLLERMAMQGIVTPDEADRLRQLAALRNQVAHGALRVAVPGEAVADLIAILREVLAESEVAAEP
ncbi:hypothetical protein [Methylobacterium brachiatum]|uniref:hypothetical protein n=1 Tax=Methylobacterium brachiatum TaxID=269660 RepID=UPI0008EFE3A2|nr:hypothetical protein [Methylobacterium brachiatum]SFJ54475.1 hypothetical protein SAMN02799642_04752 [Methylobacterium brachiatum]